MSFLHRIELLFGESPDQIEAFTGSSSRSELFLYFQAVPRELECCPRRKTPGGRWVVVVCEEHQRELLAR